MPQIGWEPKYVVFKWCKECNGEGTRPCREGDLDGEWADCPRCHGRGYHQPDDDHCYFVLSLDQDPAARYAMLAYADQVRETNPQLAADIRKEVEVWS